VSYRKGRVLRASDAAHRYSPNGEQRIPQIHRFLHAGRLDATIAPCASTSKKKSQNNVGIRKPRSSFR